MKSINVAGALLLVALCASAVSGQGTCQPSDYITYTDGTDFFGNDIGTGKPGSDQQSCISACEALKTCYALVLKADGTCYLKNKNYKANVQNLSSTVFAVDLSCLRTGSPATPATPTVAAPPGSPGAPPAPGDTTGTDTPPASIPPVTNPDGTITSTSVTELADGTYVATAITYNPKNFNSDTADDVAGDPTATSSFSDAAGAQIPDSTALGNPTVTTSGQDIVATTIVPTQTDPIVTTVTTDPTTGEPTGVTSTGGAPAETPTTPTSPDAPTAPATPPGTAGSISTDPATNYTTMVNTVMVPGTEPPQYVTINTTVDAQYNEVPDMTKAFYSDAEGNPVDPPAGAPTDLPVTTTSNPTAVAPDPLVTSSVNVTDGSGAPVTLYSSAYVAEDGTLSTYGATPEQMAAAGTGTLPPGVSAAPPPPGTLGGTPAPPSTSRGVNVTSPESGAATGLQMLSAVFAISMLGALML